MTSGFASSGSQRLGMARRDDATGGADEASNEETGVSEARRRDVGTRSRERGRSRDASAMRRR